MLLLIILLFLILPFKIYAADEFNINQNISYTVYDNGKASISQEIQLTNNFSEIYPKEYQLKLYGSNITNIRANDDQGNILQKSDNQAENTNIFLKFNQPGVGKSQITKFKLNYDIPEFATNKGSIWEISLPEYKNIKDNDSIDILIKVPSHFGNLSFSSIPAVNAVPLNNQTQIQLNTQNIKNKKALFIFGNYQMFNFDLKYFLNNPTADTISTEIALPPDTNSQTIVFKEISVLPSKIKTDTDGNWLAEYILQPNQNLSITVAGQAKILPINNSNAGIDINLLTQDQKFWPVNDSTIQQIAQTLKTPKDVYNYVVSTLNYNYDGLNNSTRKGALEALLSPDLSLCTEFTDLFVTLARAKNIPAREIEGFAFTNNPRIKPTNTTADILHAWPQYYDQSKKTWVPVDPTWGKTTNGIDYFSDLDLNHLTFVIHGKDSQYPPPPGSYKNKQNIKTINVTFANQEIKQTYLPPKIIAEKTQPNQNPKIQVINPNLNSISDMRISSTNWEKQIGSLPPLGQVEFETSRISFINSILPKYKNITYQIQYSDGKTAYFSTSYPPHYLNLSIVIGIIILTLSVSGIILSTQLKKRK